MPSQKQSKRKIFAKSEKSKLKKVSSSDTKKTEKKFVLWFKEIGIKDVPEVGGKNASLGEMYRNLTRKGIKIPYGFATTSYAYRYLLEKTGLKNEIKKILKDLKVRDMEDLAKKGREVREAILRVELPSDFKKAITEAYKQLSLESVSNTMGKPQIGKSIKSQATSYLDVAVRSSATAEDLPDASFAGQQESYLNVQGETEVLEAVKKCIASLFTNRAIAYREEKGFSHFKIALSVGVQKMIRSDKACSGVMFSCDTESGFPDVVLINASYGLGENIVQGKVDPDEYLVFETTLKQGFKPIIGKKLGSKKNKLIYSLEGEKRTKDVPVPQEDQKRFTLKDQEILQLARWSCLIEDHYARPMDIEWAKDGVDGRLYILQARPETVQSQRDVSIITNYQLQTTNHKLKILCQGTAVGSKIAQGKVNAIKDVHDIGKFKKGEILVTEMTDPDWVPIMKIASAIITNAGGRTCHAAIVSREMGIPCVVGTKNATQILKIGQEITVSCAEGEEGRVYQGLIPFSLKKANIKGLVRPKTKIMMNLGEPDQAFGLSFIPNDGIGLAREEFIINDYIKIHPLALLRLAQSNSLRSTSGLDQETIQKIEELTHGYKDKKQFFVDKLAEGIGKIAAAFYPKDVIVRFSDFKTNEYANLIGGRSFEPKESNPMIGWRGASRYYSEEFREAFVLECQAIRKIREVFGLTNIIVMIPFCRTIEEGRRVLEILHKSMSNKQQTTDNKLQVYVMCEIPSNVILAEEFAAIFDGFSIGSNDLTQLTLGVDRDSALVSHVYDERNEAVKKLIKEVIEKAHSKGKKVGICGQAPSDFPGFAEFLVKTGIDSISLNPDTIIKTTLDILKMEKRLKRSKKK